MLTDEPSPTTFDIGKLLAGFAVGGIPISIAALALTGLLRRRLGPRTTQVPPPDVEEEAG